MAQVFMTIVHAEQKFLMDSKPYIHSENGFSNLGDENLME